MPLIATKGAASAQGFGEFAQSGPAIYIEDVFSTYLYTGNGSTQTITNNIDLSTKGGLVWIKNRSTPTNTGDHRLYDTLRGINNALFSNTTDASTTLNDSLTTFGISGFTLGTNPKVNESAVTWASWTFREQPKFFDVVTFTSSASGNKTFNHNLGSTPGCVIIKNTQTADPWIVYHRSVGDNAYLQLNSTAAQDPLTGAFSVSSTQVTISSSLMYNSQTYVAYLFAHDAGGFGLTGSDNVITCGSYTGNGSTSGPTVTLGYEPQWLMIKTSTTTGSWQMIDNMRGMVVGGNEARLLANSTSAELSNDYLSPTATGFQLVSTSSEVNGNGQTYIYIAIRRGPMKTPTSGTSVFTPVAYTGNGSTRSYSVGFPTDLSINMTRSFAGDAPTWNDRLRGTGNDLYSSSTQAESAAGSAGVQFDNNTNIIVPNYRIINGDTYIDWCMRRAPGFFDEVCYTGDGTLNRQVNHNLTVTPELIIAKRRSGAQSWIVFGSVISTNNYLILDSTGALNSLGATTVYASTSTTFGAQAFLSYNDSAVTYVAYLFASCPGVSKVGSYTGTGALQTVNCGFTGGARFVLIKRTDSTGDWWVYDSARGISSGNDPYLFLNSSAAEVTNTNYVDTTSVGFQVTAAAPAALNANGGSYIFWAVA